MWNVASPKIGKVIALQSIAVKTDVFYFSIKRVFNVFNS